MTRLSVKVGPLGQRKLWGWATALSLPGGLAAYLTGLAADPQFTAMIVVVSVFLSCMALWLQTRVEVKVDPDITDPKKEP